MNSSAKLAIFIPSETRKVLVDWKDYLFDSATMPGNKLDYFGIRIGNTMYKFFKLGGKYFLKSHDDTFALGHLN